MTENLKYVRQEDKMQAFIFHLQTHKIIQKKTESEGKFMIKCSSL